MALTTCPNCGANISDKATICPHCKSEVSFEIPELITINVCEDCGFEIPEGYSECPNCGCPVETKTTESTEDIQKVEVAAVKVPVKKKTKGLIITIASLITLGIIFLVVFFIAIPSAKYSKAQSLLEEGNYAEAISLYDSLGEFKKAEEKKLECNYLWGKEQYNKRQYDEALNLFNNAKGYLDSDKYIEEIEHINYAASLKSKLKSAYNLCSSRARMSYDGTSITVDSRNKYDDTGVADIAKIIVALGMTDSILDSMGQTSALMGRQSATSNGYKVEWTYHPDDGLDAIFSIAE